VETKLVNSEKLIVPSPARPAGEGQGHHGAQRRVARSRPILASMRTGKQVWRFYTAGGEEGNGDARNTWATPEDRGGGG
jgi:hypothetical protein